MNRAQFLELLRWCLPALVLGLLLRVMLTVELPFAIYHPDTPDFLSTADRLWNDGKLSIHTKKTFLYPLYLALHCAGPVPALKSIVITQHALGLLSVVLVGFLARLWIRQWRLMIMPLTVLTAINPGILWYEHVAIAEFLYMFCTLVLACVGTWYSRKPTTGVFVGLCVALVFEAGARPEGKLLFGFGVLLILLMHWRQRPLVWKRAGALVAVAIGTHFITQTGQGGLLLYTSLARFTPEKLHVAPEFEPYIAPVRQRLSDRWEERRSFPGGKDRRAVGAAIQKYKKDHNERGSAERFCRRFAIETCLRNLDKMPGWLLAKFRATMSKSTAEPLQDYLYLGDQKDAFLSAPELFERMSVRMAGVPLFGEKQIDEFIRANYTPVFWFNEWLDDWTDEIAKRSFPKEGASHIPKGKRLPGVPIYFAVAGLGVVLLMLRADPSQRFHIAWGIGLIGLFLVIFITANVRPRFRFVFEPFWALYIAVLLDLFIGWGRRFLRRRNARSPAMPVAVSSLVPLNSSSERHPDSAAHSR